MHLQSLLRSSPIRLALVYVALFGSSALLLLAFFYWSTAGFMLSQSDETTEAEIAGLAERYRTAGLAGLTALIDTRLERQPSGSSLYLVTDSSYNPLVGNLSGWPQVSPDDDGWLNFRLNPRDDEPVHWARAKSFRLQGGFHLLAGRDMYELQAIRSMIVRNIAWGLALTVVLALLGGFLVGRGRLRRIGTINKAIDGVMAGDLTRRIPPDPAGDDIEQLVDNLNRMLGELQTLVDGVRRVSDNIAHDLRTPLARLRNRLELLRQGGDESNQRHVAEQAIQEADSLLDTFNALLRIARIESGKRRQAFKAIDLSPLVDDLVEMYKPLMEEAGLSLETVPTPEIIIVGDRDLIFQALANLIDNTLKYVPAGSRVVIQVAETETGARVVVADNGSGIPAGQRDQVLERFYRLDSSRSTTGAGLGLSLVAAVADLHHGQIKIEDNKPGLRAVLDLNHP